MGVTETSKEAYKGIVPILGETQTTVLSALVYLKEATNAEIADFLDWSINRVTPRIFELREEGYVVGSGERLCKITGHNASVWMVNKKSKEKKRLNECIGCHSRVYPHHYPECEKGDGGWYE